MRREGLKFLVMRREGLKMSYKGHKFDLLKLLEP